MIKVKFSPGTRAQLFILMASSLALGMFTDFVVIGVFKVIWIAIYATTYVTCASTLYSHVHRKYDGTSRIPLASAILFLLGALISHLFFIGSRETRVYPMDKILENPLTLQSPKISQTLVVMSDRVSQLLAESHQKTSIPVSVQVTKDYGCITAFRVGAVGGVDVMGDIKATWTWREGTALSLGARYDGKNEENRRLPWCRFVWYDLF